MYYKLKISCNYFIEFGSNKLMNVFILKTEYVVSLQLFKI